MDLLNGPFYFYTATMVTMRFLTCLGAVAVTLGGVMAAKPGEGRQTPNRKATTMSIREKNVHVMLEIFRAIEERDPQHEDLQRELALVQPDVEFHWPPSLPYGGTFRGATRPTGETWGGTWTPLQPTPAERRMDPRVIGTTDDEVAILYRQRGVSPAGERFDGQVLGLYQLRDFKLARAQMFHFDEAAAASFLARAAIHGGR
jgi:ketosteroid isomerase-like protein